MKKIKVVVVIVAFIVFLLFSGILGYKFIQNEISQNKK